MEQSRRITMIEVITTLSDDELKEGYESVLDELLSDPNDEELMLTKEVMEFDIVRRWTRSLEVNIVGKRQ